VLVQSGRPRSVTGIGVKRQPAGPTDDRPQKSPQSCFPSPTSTSPRTTRALQSAEVERFAARVLAMNLQTLWAGESRLPRKAGRAGGVP
jgi:hypothetical protein